MTAKSAQVLTVELPDFTRRGVIHIRVADPKLSSWDSHFKLERTLYRTPTACMMQRGRDHVLSIDVHPLHEMEYRKCMHE